MDVILHLENGLSFWKGNGLSFFLRDVGRGEIWQIEMDSSASPYKARRVWPTEEDQAQPEAGRHVSDQSNRLDGPIDEHLWGKRKPSPEEDYCSDCRTFLVAGFCNCTST